MKGLFIIIFICITGGFIHGQSTESKPEDKPVRAPFETVYLVDYPTTLAMRKGSFQIYINHRFGSVENGISDIFGIYAPSNIQMSLMYGITNSLSVGISSEKDRKMQGVFAKWVPYQQTRSGTKSFSLALYGRLGIDARNEEFFGLEYENLHRLNYFYELMISRKFSSALSLQAGLSYSHFNIVSQNRTNDYIGMHLSGKFSILDIGSLIFEYTHPFGIGEEEKVDSQTLFSGLSTGLEFGTGTHGFQVFVTNCKDILPNYIVSDTYREYFEGEVLLGFNITVRM